jgi:quinol monooxygenase YgiN
VHRESLSVAFVAKITAASGSEDDLAELLTGAVALANAEEGTVVWFAVRTTPDTFWIFDAFANEDDRQVHASGQIVAALNENANLLRAEPEIMPADILASKLP